MILVLNGQRCTRDKTRSYLLRKSLQTGFWYLELWWRRVWNCCFLSDLMLRWSSSPQTDLFFVLSPSHIPVSLAKLLVSLTPVVKVQLEDQSPGKLKDFKKKNFLQVHISWIEIELLTLSFIYLYCISEQSTSVANEQVT